MNPFASDEQAMLSGSVERFARSQAGVSPEAVLDGLVELGLVALAAPAEAGGMAGKADDAMVMMEAIGHGLLGTSAIALHAAADLLGRHGTPGQRRRWLAPAVEGRLRLAFAVADELAAAQHGLSGRVDFVAGGERADAFVVATPAAAFLVEAAASGVEVAPFRIADGSTAARLRLAGVAAEPIPASADEVADGLARARVAACAMMLGIMERLLSDTRAHVATRQQFGVAIGSFQTIQHRMARLYVATGQCRSLVMAAALGEGGGRRAWLRSVAAAAALVAERGMHLAHECVQFHGGMGITRELEVSRGHRQMMVLSRLFGGAADARRAFDRLSG